MTLATETRVDEQTTLSSLETLIAKRQQAATMREAVNQHYRELNDSGAAERKAAQVVEQLDTRVKSYHKQLLLGTANPGKLPALKQQLSEAKDLLARTQQALEERSATYGVGKEALTQLLTEIGDLDRHLRNSLAQLFTQRFYQHDTGLYGKRGQVTWQEPDPNSSARWQAQWRDRAFNFLLYKGLASDLRDNHLLYALVAFFRQTPFCVQVTSGFMAMSTKGKEPLTLGVVLSIPKQMSVEEAFDEIQRKRVQFVTDGLSAERN